MLKPAFQTRDEFAPASPYRLLPFRFNRLGERYVATNDVGEYVILDHTALKVLINRRLEPAHPAYPELKAKHFFFDEHSRVALDLTALKYRSRLERLAEFTALHIFVVTLRCDHSCHYCQVSRQSEDRHHFDMSIEHAEKALAFVFRSPSRHLKLEFQGGESLLNFGLIRHIVTRAKELNRVHRRELGFVIATNLSRLNDEVLEFCREHEILLSTSLDGPSDLHDAQRPIRNASSHALVVDGIERARAALGTDRVAALMTTTPASLERVEDIIDEYVRLGFRSIFLRSLSPYGFAARSLVRRYDVQRWLSFYKRGIHHILELNRSGHAFREEHAGILLHKIFGATGSGYVDLQSPAGIGIGALVYNYDGAVYASDEGRMLAEMGDQTFRLGHLDEHSYEELLTSDRLLEPLEASVLESAPGCSDCAFLPYCGADPVFHHATSGDWLGHKSFSAFCEKQTGILEFLIQLLEHNPDARKILLRWQ